MSSAASPQTTLTPTATNVGAKRPHSLSEMEASEASEPSPKQARLQVAAPKTVPRVLGPITAVVYKLLGSRALYPFLRTGAINWEMWHDRVVAAETEASIDWGRPRLAFAKWVPEHWVSFFAGQRYTGASCDAELMLMLECMVMSLCSGDMFSDSNKNLSTLTARTRSRLEAMGKTTEDWRDHFLARHVINGVGMIPLVKYDKAAPLRATRSGPSMSSMPSMSASGADRVHLPKTGHAANWYLDTSVFSPKNLAERPRPEPLPDSAIRELAGSLVREYLAVDEVPREEVVVMTEAMIKMLGDRALYPFMSGVNKAIPWGVIWARHAVAGTVRNGTVRGRGTGCGESKKGMPTSTKDWVAFFARQHPAGGQYGSYELQITIDALVQEMIDEGGLRDLRARVRSVLDGLAITFAKEYTDRFIVDGCGFVPLVMYSRCIRPSVLPNDAADDIDCELVSVGWELKFHAMLPELRWMMH